MNKKERKVIPSDIRAIFDPLQIVLAQAEIIESKRMFDSINLPKKEL